MSGAVETPIADQPAPPGWEQFKAYADIVSEHLDRNAILGLRRAEVTGSPSRRLFVHTFEAAIAVSRDETVAPLIKDKIASAAELITFIRPFTSANIKGFEAGPTASPDEVLNSFARCLACAIVRSKTIPPSPDLVAQEFRRCRAAWESATIDYDIIAPIWGIQADFLTPHEVVQGLNLAWETTLSDQTKDTLEECSPSKLVGRRALIVLRGRATKDKCGADSRVLMREARQTVTLCVTAIRLATGKIVGCDTVFILQSDSHFQTFNAVANYIVPLPETAIYAGDRLGIGDALSDSRSSLYAASRRNCPGPADRCSKLRLSGSTWRQVDSR